ncbi:cytochrome P450, partial [Russula vinacea]
MAGQIILSVAYGIDVRPEGDPFVEDAENVLHALVLGSKPEATLFDIITWLLHMPSWFPGAGFKRCARKWRPIVDNALQTPHDKVKGELACGTAAPSVAANMISKLDEISTELDLFAAKSVPGTMYVGGADTTVTALETFILAMTLYPKVQRKAQAEIDSVVGNSRLPDYSDQDALPYVQAVLKEVLRWHPVAPLGVSHKVIKSDVYEGHFIPAGSTVIPNVWGMLHDPNIFTEPDRFYPERWFSPNAPAFPIQAFGFGARQCPGRFFIVPMEDGPPEKKHLSGIISCVVLELRNGTVANLDGFGGTGEPLQNRSLLSLEMSHSLRRKAKARTASIAELAASGPRCMENIPISNETVGKRRAGAVEMTITNVDDEGSGSNADTTEFRRKQRHGELERLRSHTPQPLRRREQVICRRESWDCVTSSIEDNTDAIASTMEWRRMVLQSQKESQATSTHQYREGRSRAKLDAEVQRIRQHYLKQEKILEREIVRLERRYEWTIAQLEREEQDDGSYSVDGWEE